MKLKTNQLKEGEQKMSENINKNKDMNKDKIGKDKALRYGGYAAVVVMGSMFGAEMALAAAKFDINAGVTAATDPLINGIKAHWGKGVLLTGTGAALLGEGDGRQRATRAAIAAGSAGGVILGLIALLT